MRRPRSRRPSITARGSSSGANPASTTTGEEVHPSAAAQECRPSSTSPRTSASTISASSRASQAPRTSASRAYTWAAAKATSRV